MGVGVLVGGVLVLGVMFFGIRLEMEERNELMVLWRVLVCLVGIVLLILLRREEILERLLINSGLVIFLFYVDNIV